MKTFLVILIAVSIHQLTFSQKSDETQCLLQHQNEVWKSKYLSAKDKSDQIGLIKEKILADSIYSSMHPRMETVHGPSNTYQDQKGNDCGCKISIILTTGSTKYLELDLGDSRDIEPVIGAINSQNIDTIYHNLHLKKYRGSKCGVVKLTTSDEELTSIVKNVWQHRL